MYTIVLICNIHVFPRKVFPMIRVRDKNRENIYNVYRRNKKFNWLNKTTEKKIYRYFLNNNTLN